MDDYEEEEADGYIAFGRALRPLDDVPEGLLRKKPIAVEEQIGQHSIFGLIKITLFE